MIRAAFALRITATDVVPMIIMSLLFACVEPASVFTARSVQPWSSAVIIVTRCIVSQVACLKIYVQVLIVREPFVIPVAQMMHVGLVARAGASIVMIAWSVIGAI